MLRWGNDDLLGVRPAGFRGRRNRKDGAMVQTFGPVTFGLTVLSLALAISAAGVWGSIRIAERCGERNISERR